MKMVTGPNMPKSNGHYSMCTEHNGTLYISGQLPLRLEDRSLPETINEQTLLVLQKLEMILHAAGSSKDKVIHVRIYLTDVKYWSQVNEIYSTFFGDHKPARVVIPVGPLHYGCDIELEAVAAC